MKFQLLLEETGRRYWAFLVILGGCFVFILMAAVGVYLVSGNVKYSFYLALAAHIQLLIGMSTFGFVLGRRLKAKAGKDGLEFDDSGVNGHSSKTTVEVETKG